MWLEKFEFDGFMFDGVTTLAQWVSARSNLDLPKIEATSKVSASKLRHLGVFLQIANPLRFC